MTEKNTKDKPAKDKPEIDRPSLACERLITGTRSLQLATLGEDGFPHCGYTPFVVSSDSHDETLVSDAPVSDALVSEEGTLPDETALGARRFYVFVSELAIHTRDLIANPQASIMVIEDEASSSQIFARTRVYYECEAALVATSDESYNALLDQYQERHGKMVGLLRQLPDFRLFRLDPLNGQFVMGFGKAYKLTGDNLRHFEHSRRA